MTPSLAATAHPLEPPRHTAGPFRLGVWLVRPDRHCIVDRSAATREGSGELHLEPKVMDLLVRLSEADGEVTQFRDWGIPLGRRFRSLKIWFHLRLDGPDAIRARIRRDLDQRNH